MGRPSKTVAKKTSEKDNKTVVETTVDAEKKEDAVNSDNIVKEEEIPTASVDREETNNNTETVDTNKEEVVETISQENGNKTIGEPKEETVTLEEKTVTEEPIVEKPRRWMKDVYGYNWNGQCFDE